MQVTPGVFEITLPQSETLGAYTFAGSVSVPDPDDPEGDPIPVEVPALDPDTGDTVVGPVDVGPGAIGTQYTTLTVPTGPADVGASVACVIQAYDGQVRPRYNSGNRA